MAQKIIGRIKERRELAELVNSGRPEFVVVYGRRRVGKTFLVREFFDNKFCFQHTGLSPVELKGKNFFEQQLSSFTSSLVRYGVAVDKAPASWLDAFDLLIDFLAEKCSQGRQVVFIDEMPWLDTPRSGFVTAFEHFWNGWGAGQPNLMLIVCGSATSWVSDVLINNHGGLYGRTTAEIYVEPFTLRECEEYYKGNGLSLDRYDQLQIYMAFGGIPYYMSMVKKGMSVAQNIDNLCFGKRAKLALEFQRLYSSLFVNYEDCIKIVEALSTRRDGFSRKEIAEHTGLPYGGGLTKTLKALEVSDMIISYVDYGQPKRNTKFKLIDFFSMFYLRFMRKNKSVSTFWQDSQFLGEANAWRGYAFEDVCFCHVAQIKAALGIAGVQTNVAPWRSQRKEGGGAQVDMVIERRDHIVNLCEIKYCDGDFTIDNDCDSSLRNKLQVFIDETRCKLSPHITLITTSGLVNNAHYGRVQSLVVLDDLFA